MYGSRLTKSGFATLWYKIRVKKRTVASKNPGGGNRIHEELHHRCVIPRRPPVLIHINDMLRTMISVSPMPLTIYWEEDT